MTETFKPENPPGFTTGIGYGEKWSSVESNAYVVKSPGRLFMREGSVERMVRVFDSERLCVLASGVYSKKRRVALLESEGVEKCGKCGIIARVAATDGIMQDKIYPAISDGHGEHWVICGFPSRNSGEVDHVGCSRDYIIEDALHNWKLFDFVLWCNIDMSDFMAFFRKAVHLDKIAALL